MMAAGMRRRNSTGVPTGGRLSETKRRPLEETFSVTALTSPSGVVRTMSKCRGKRTADRSGTGSSGGCGSDIGLLGRTLEGLFWIAKKLDCVKKCNASDRNRVGAIVQSRRTSHPGPVPIVVYPHHQTAPHP